MMMMMFIGTETLVTQRLRFGPEDDREVALNKP